VKNYTIQLRAMRK